MKEPRGFKKARRKAEKILANNGRVDKLLKKANSKGLANKSTLQKVWGDIQTLIRLVKCYIEGSYREVALSTMFFAVAGLVYFVNPFDVIPDFILGFGFIDDATVLVYVITKIKTEIDQFLIWETEKPLEIDAVDSEESN